MLVIKIKYTGFLPFDVEIYENNTLKKTYSTIHDIPAISEILRSEVKRYEEVLTNKDKETNKD